MEKVSETHTGCAIELRTRGLRCLLITCLGVGKDGSGPCGAKEIQEILELIKQKATEIIALPEVI